MNNDFSIAVLDSGIYPHPDFNNRILVFRDFIHNRATPYDDCGHGTHVSGIIAGSGFSSGGKIKGMYPNGKLVILKVLDKFGDGKIEDVLKACEWILLNHQRYNIKIVNISFGTTSYSKCKDASRLIEITEQIWNQGIAVVAAAGNDGPGKCTIAIPGTSKKIITVGSPDGRSFYSGRGPTKDSIVKPDVCVNGSSIISCSNYGASYSIKSGTSMSAPIVSGAIACLLSKKTFAPKQIKIRLINCCKKSTLVKDYQGTGLLDINAFLSIS